MEKQLQTKTNGSLKSIILSPEAKQQFALALPKHLTPDRFVRVALTAINKTPKLAQCTKESFLNCMLDLSSMGLEPDGRKAHLIPYGQTCTLIVDYKGLVDMAMRSGTISNIHADVVCENDEFEYNVGVVEKHKINFKKERGKMYAVYSMVTFKDGTVKCEVMSKDDIDAIRNRSKAGTSGPWKTDYNEMAKKTVFRRHSKWLPLSSEFQEAIEKDGDLPSNLINAEEVAEPMVGLKSINNKPEAEPTTQSGATEKKKLSKTLSAVDVRMFEAKAKLKTVYPEQWEQFWYDGLGARGVEHCNQLEKDSAKIEFTAYINELIKEGSK